MKRRQKKPLTAGVLLCAGIWMFIVVPLSAVSAPYAAMVMDARNGKVLSSENADTRLHPASLTKMMTLYIAFEAIENGEISADKKVRISKKASLEPLANSDYDMGSVLNCATLFAPLQSDRQMTLRRPLEKPSKGPKPPLRVG